MNLIPQLQPSQLDVVVYDIEIKKCIPDRDKQNDPSLQYCNGWGDHAGMGIAVLAAYDTRAGLPRVFCEDNLDEFQKLISGRTVAGFNNIGFDEKVLLAHGIHVTSSYDLMCEVRAALGLPRSGPGGAGRKLDELARVNLGVQKSMNGVLAPVQWQRGKVGEVIDYCLRDVMLTLALIERCPDLVDPVTGNMLDVRMPPTLELLPDIPIGENRIAEVRRPAAAPFPGGATDGVPLCNPENTAHVEQSNARHDAAPNAGYRDHATDWGG
jgi:hypothetical protein